MMAKTFGSGEHCSLGGHGDIKFGLILRGFSLRFSVHFTSGLRYRVLLGVRLLSGSKSDLTHGEEGIFTRRVAIIPPQRTADLSYHFDSQHFLSMGDHVRRRRSG